ncbi:unnamed protein product [marine sediment metagenome]|uniref:Uncharacterized protein n=1 Tax=marine sediment metagenome TaxID=412755 RepID=X0YGE9_9ZZZZ
MAKIAALPAMSVISGFKGVIDYYMWKGIACVRKWPRSPGHLRAPAVEAQWPAFTEASKIWVTLSPEVQDAYNRMAAGTHMSGRDIQVKTYLSNFSIVRL